jgi:hypothetical protein
VDWWGASNLPPGLQIIRYTANGLNLNSDEITLWNATATSDEDWICSVAFSTAAPGVSKWFLPTNQCFYSKYGVLSVEGEGGAFRAAKGHDIGSPGWTIWTSWHVTSFVLDQNGVTLEWKSQPNTTNIVQYREEVDRGEWTTLETHLPAGAVTTHRANDPRGGAGARRFYRVITVPHWTCPSGPP